MSHRGMVSSVKCDQNSNMMISALAPVVYRVDRTGETATAMHETAEVTMPNRSIRPPCCITAGGKFLESNDSVSISALG